MKSPFQARGRLLTCVYEQSLIPVVMAGIIAVYSLVISVLIAGDLSPPPKKNYSLYRYVRRGILHIILDLTTRYPQRVHASGCWSFSWPQWACGRLCDWHCRRHGQLPLVHVWGTLHIDDIREYDLICSNQEYSLAWYSY